MGSPGSETFRDKKSEIYIISLILWVTDLVSDFEVVVLDPSSLLLNDIKIKTGSHSWLSIVRSLGFDGFGC